MALRKPDWMKMKFQGSGKALGVENMVKDLNLHTVCHEANCPNKMECFERRTATFMILGRNCTRNCTFCNVTREMPDPVDPQEPKNVARAVDLLNLRHAVITSVTRDDLEDQGANQFAQVIKEIRALDKNVTVEVLIPDLRCEKPLLDIIFKEKPDVLNHNVETVPSLYGEVRPMADFQRSLDVLAYAKEKGMVTKSGIMVGLGETKEQVVEVLKALREVDCDMVTIGQYLQPTASHIELKEYVTPERFKEYEDISYELGFKRVSSGPFVRSSYHADTL